MFQLGDTLSVRLETLRFAAQLRIERALLRDGFGGGVHRLEWLRDFIDDGFMLRIQSKFCGLKQDFQLTPVPLTWWDHFKRDAIPTFTRLLKLNVAMRSETLTAATIYKDLPHILGDRFLFSRRRADCRRERRRSKSMTRPRAIAMICVGIVASVVMIAVMMPLHKAEQPTKNALRITQPIIVPKEEAWQTKTTTTMTAGHSAPAIIETVNAPIASPSKVTPAGSALAATIASSPRSESMTGAKLEKEALNDRRDERASARISEVARTGHPRASAPIDATPKEMEERWANALHVNVSTAIVRNSLHVRELAPNASVIATTTVALAAPTTHPNIPPDCSYIHLAVPPDQQAFYIAKANEWAASPLVGGWFYCRADLVMNWFTYAQQQAAKRPAELAEDPVPFLFKYGCYGGCEFPNITGPQAFTFTRTPGCLGCNLIEVSLWRDGSLVQEPDVFDDVDPDAEQITVTIVAPYVHVMPRIYMWPKVEALATAIARNPISRPAATSVK